MTMAAEIKNRVGPPAAAQPGAAGRQGGLGLDLVPCRG